MGDVKANALGGGGAGDATAGAPVPGAAVDEPGLGIGKDLAISGRGFLRPPPGLPARSIAPGRSWCSARSGAASPGALADALVADFGSTRTRRARRAGFPAADEGVGRL